MHILNKLPSAVGSTVNRSIFMPRNRSLSPSLVSASRRALRQMLPMTMTVIPIKGQRR